MFRNQLFKIPRRSLSRLGRRIMQAGSRGSLGSSRGPENRRRARGKLIFGITEDRVSSDEFALRVTDDTKIVETADKLLVFSISIEEPTLCAPQVNKLALLVPSGVPGGTQRVCVAANRPPNRRPQLGLLNVSEHAIRHLPHNCGHGIRRHSLIGGDLGVRAADPPRRGGSVLLE